MGKPVFAEIDQNSRWIEIYFRPDQKWISVMHHCRAVFMPKDRGGPFWRMPIDYEDAKLLADEIGEDNLELGDALVEWARRHKESERTIQKILKAKTARLEHLPQKLPALHKTLKPFQKKGVKFAAFVDHPAIGDHPGLGKTLEAIGAIFEAGTEEGPNLVIAPLTALETVWEFELMRWQDFPVIVAAEAGAGRAKREERLHEAMTARDAGMPFWLVVNPDMVRMRRKYPAVHDDDSLKAPFEFIHETEWANIIIDECHKNAVRNPSTLTAKGMFGLKLKEGGKRIAMSGTLVGGKPVNLWGVLHYLHPERFTSKWRWANQWLEVIDNGFGKDIGDVKKDKREEFFKHLEPYVLRRTKSEVLPELPDKQHIDLWCDMTPKQAKQYKEFQKKAEIKIGKEEISATNILAEYTRLKQFAGAVQKVQMLGEDKLKLKATPDSGKIPMLMDKFDELGIIEGEGEEQAVVFTQFTEMAEMLFKHLKDQGIPCLLLTGKQNKKGERKKLQEDFQGSKARVMIMNTKTGGLSITLDRASHVFILDETWNPDDQEQAEDRCHRASRIHQVTCYYIRSKGTIEEYIKRTTDEKSEINWTILDLKRLGDRMKVVPVGNE